MKCAIVLYEGAADFALENLQGRTPLEAARCPNAAHLAALGQTGLLAPVGSGFEARTEVRIAAFLGLPPKTATALERAPLEAAGLGVDTAGYDLVCRANFLTADGPNLVATRPGPARPEEIDALLQALQANWPEAAVKFVPLGDWSVLVLVKTLQTVQHRPAQAEPPFLLEIGCRLDEFMPADEAGAPLNEIMARSREILGRHEVNAVRVDLGEDPANMLWLWGAGRPQSRLTEPVRLRGCIISQSPLARGLAQLCGMPALGLHEPWRDGPVAFKVADAVAAAREHDLLFVYAPAPRDLAGYGSAGEKVRALEALDHRVLGPFIEVLEAERPFRIALASDGAIATETGQPAAGDCPVAIAGEAVEPDTTTRWDEKAVLDGTLGTVSPGDVWARLTGLRAP